MKQSIDYRKIREALSSEFDSRCAYCGSTIGITDVGNIEHFYPRNKYPEMELNPDNLLYVCQVCNISKADKFPVDASGEPLLLNPRIDNLDEHIRIDTEGTVSPLTERGRQTIETLNLNRPRLVESRKYKLLEESYISGFKASPPDTYAVFKESISKIRELNAVIISATDGLQEYFNNILYANVITALETYLCDTFIENTTSKKGKLRKFVESFHDFHKEKFELRELFKIQEEIKDKSIKAMRDVIYHDLPKVSGMYRDTLEIEFPKITDVYKEVFIRHDLVHRNGKSKEGKKHNISKENISALCDKIDAFVENIHLALKG